MEVRFVSVFPTWFRKSNPWFLYLQQRRKCGQDKRYVNDGRLRIGPKCENPYSASPGGPGELRRMSSKVASKTGSKDTEVWKGTIL